MMHSRAGVYTSYLLLRVTKELFNSLLARVKLQAKLYPLRCACELASVGSHVSAVWRTPGATAPGVNEDAQTRRNTGGWSLLT